MFNNHENKCKEKVFSGLTVFGTSLAGFAIGGGIGGRFGGDTGCVIGIVIGSVTGAVVSGVSLFVRHVNRPHNPFRVVEEQIEEPIEMPPGAEPKVVTHDTKTAKKAISPKIFPLPIPKSPSATYISQTTNGSSSAPVLEDGFDCPVAFS
ncbi:MAG: hypothetical protein WCW01_01315 [Gammaproteobacteria bacterium]